MMHRPSVRCLLMLSVCLALVLLHASKALSQTPEKNDTATKFDEFGQLRGCDLSARLDNFAITLQQFPGAEGYIISYGPQGEGPGTGNFNLLVIENYLVNSRGVEKERLRTIHDGPNKSLKELGTELWIVPHGAEPPKPEKYENGLSSFTGKFDEYTTSDRIFEGEIESSGPYPGDPTLINFVDALRHQPETRAYIVAYSSPQAAMGAWRRVAKNLADNLENTYGVQPDRIKMIFAGYDKTKNDDEYGEETRVQLWILPRDAPPPVKEAKAERRPKELVQIGSFSKYILRYPDNVKRIFEGFVDVLSADEQLRVCVIYRPLTEPPDPEVDPDVPPNADLPQLVEKWKIDLVKRYKIDKERLVVIPAAAMEEWNAGTLETWIVPPGSQLPDPYPPQEEVETGEAEGGNPQGF